MRAPRIASWLLLAVPVMLPAVPMSAVARVAPCFDDGQAVLDEARSLLRQGLLSEAESVLALLSPKAVVESRAHANLLRGNIAYERGRYSEARDAYAESESLFRDAASHRIVDVAAGLEAAQANRALADTQVERADELQQQARQLRGITWAVLVCAAAGVAWLALRVRPLSTQPAGGLRRPS